MSKVVAMALFTGLSNRACFCIWPKNKVFCVENCSNNFWSYLRWLQKWLMSFFKKTFRLGARGWPTGMSHDHWNVSLQSLLRISEMTEKLRVNFSVVGVMSRKKRAWPELTQVACSNAQTCYLVNIKWVELSCSYLSTHTQQSEYGLITHNKVRL